MNLKNCYTDIIKLIDPYKNSSSSSLENPNIVLMLNKEQMLAGIKKNKLGAEGTKVNLVNLLDCVRPLCLPSYQCDTRPKLSSSSQDCDISALTSRVDSLCTQNRVDFESIKTQMESLKTTLSTFENAVVNPHQPHQSVPSPEPIPIRSGHVLAVEHSIPAVCTYSDNFIASNESSELFEYLNNLSIYKQERGRSTIKFGEKYAYNGSREDSIVDFPPLIKSIIDKLNDTHVGHEIPLLNSCLVTKYTGPNSFIPEHSDNERAIHPGSSIFTVSLGLDATVQFRNVHSGDVQDQHIKSGSLYAMTRASQDLFKHSIAKKQSLTESETRISLTFRSLHWRNNNSTVIVGDSNTGGLKFSSFGKDASSDRNGTFGNAMPGKRVATFKVEQLDPLTCIGYNNVFVHCGINDIRGSEVSTEDQVRNVYVNLKTKISDIKTLNKRARIYVSTLLPTKSEDINKKVKLFNSFLRDDLPLSFEYIRVVQHYSRFSTVSGLLAPNISKEFNSQGDPDTLHLNAAGLRLFGSVIKNAIFYRKNSHSEGGTGGGGRVQQDSRSYSSALSDTGRRGRRRGGVNSRPRQPR